MQPQNKIAANKTELKALIGSWLALRQRLMVQFHHLCSFRPFDQDNSREKILIEALDRFCEELVDYISMGQFEVFEQLFGFIEKTPDNHLLTNKRLLAEFIKTTMSALDFNDKYSQKRKLDQLEEDLSLIGERLAHRLELEDKLVDMVAKNIS
jgi:regulator of sigma D